MTMKILVIGATGRTGMRIIQNLKSRPYQLIAVARNISKARAILPPDISVREQDLREHSSFDSLVADADVIIFAAGSTTFNAYWAGNNRPEDIDYQAVRQLAMAAVNHHVKKFILVSSMGVHQPYHPLNLLGRVLHWKKMGEDALRSTHLNYTIIRPGQLIDEGHYPERLCIRQDNKVHYKPVSRAEVAEVVRQSIALPAATRITFEMYRDQQIQPLILQQQMEGLIQDTDRTLDVLSPAN